MEDIRDYIKRVKDIPKETASGKLVFDENRLQLVSFVYDVMNRIFSETGSDVEITARIHELTDNTAYVKIVGGDLSINDTLWFERCASLANSIEVSPMLNGKIQMVFGFDYMLIPTNK